MADLVRKVEIARELKKRERLNKLDIYDPYPFQERFHSTGRECNQRLLMAGNRVGKSMSGAAELAMHVTGRYPDWWQGRRFHNPIVAWACGVSNETTRDIVQAELLGAPEDPSALGTGWIPHDCIVTTERKPGVPNAKSLALVKHISGGNSTLQFKSYEMGVEKFMGRAVSAIWLDEEPSRDLYSQCVTRTLSTKGMTFLTFTPESGMTETVHAFLNNLQPGQSLTTAAWDDASEKIRSKARKPGHLTQSVMEQILSAYSPHEREMRRYGRPAIGSGLVFPVDESKLMVEPFTIPDEWPRVAGIDFGFDHKTAVVYLAHDREEDVVYVYDVYALAKAAPHIHAAAMKTRPLFIPVIWPHDGHRRDAMGNPGLADQYRNLGCNMHFSHFENPPAPGEKKGGNSIETGIMEMLQRMENDKFKVFSTLGEWWQEFRIYHRKEGRIVDRNDDIMAATRYGALSLRFAASGKDDRWDQDIKYPKLGIV